MHPIEYVYLFLKKENVGIWQAVSEIINERMDLYILSVCSTDFWLP